MACRHGRTKTASALLAAGADVNKADKGGNTMLSIACEEGHLEQVQLACSYGASRDFTHWSALECHRLPGHGAGVWSATSAEELAARYNHDELLAWLITSRH